jgi:hypothetical protein
MLNSNRFAIWLAISGLVHASARGEWQEHRIHQRDPQGGSITRPAVRQELKHPDSKFTLPFGLVSMDNGELALLCSRERTEANIRKVEAIIAFSKDAGATWSNFSSIPDSTDRPMLFTALGKGRLSCLAPRRFFSSDYGRTWPESVVNPPTREGRAFNSEGNAWVDRDDEGRAKAILELGWHYAPGKSHPKDDATVVFRRSIDGGQTWIDEVSPPQWKFSVDHQGKTWQRGVSEGALVRAANGDLVAALRTDMPPRYFDGPHDDSLEGTAISISSDDGKSWSQMQFLFQAGRHHANLQRLPNGDLVCTLVVRDDIQQGKTPDDKLTSQRRGCDAVVSKDHGKTWNLDRRYELDSFDFLRPDGYWVDGMCGHIAAVALPDGQVISAYGHYQLGAAVLVKWKPGDE